MVSVSKALNGLRRYNMQAARVPSKSAALAWVGVYPLDTKLRTTAEFLNSRGHSGSDSPIFRVRYFTISENFNYNEEWVSEEQINNLLDIIVSAEECLEKCLNDIGIEISDMCLPYKCDYPI